MTLGEILSAGVVLQSFGIVGLLVVDSAATPAEPSTKHTEREALRQQHKTTLIQRQHEGCGIDQVPNGTYGFTYAPVATSPLFAAKSYQSFEMHKAADGRQFLLGFVTPEEAVQLDKAVSAVEVKLFPDPYEGSTTFVCLALSRLQRKTTNPYHEQGNFVPFFIEPQK
jgi:hypothetical protein